jgi:hypothetical protein
MGRNMMVRGHRRAVAILAVGLWAAGLLLVAPTAQAEPTTSAPTATMKSGGAASSPTSGHLVRRVTAQATLDCVNMTAEVHKYAVEHKYCSANGEAGTDTTVVGNCGSSYIDIFDDFPGDLQGRVSYGFTSFQGTVVQRTLGIYWSYTPAGIGTGGPIFGLYTDSALMFDVSYAGTAYALESAPGAWSVQLLGGVTLLWGGKCVILIPYAFAVIT